MSDTLIKYVPQLDMACSPPAGLSTNEQVHTGFASRYRVHIIACVCVCFLCVVFLLFLFVCFVGCFGCLYIVHCCRQTTLVTAVYPVSVDKMC